MCGLAGYLYWSKQPARDSVERMSEMLIHRGPDDHDAVHLKDISLAHRRLSIIDLSEKAKQPMRSADGRYYIVYNGEVYNFQELKKDLINAGYVFRNSSDTEVVLSAYIHWGADCLNKFNGMFALAIWDNLDRELFLARDRFGKKPLYYHLDPLGRMTFASELTALMENKDISKIISPEGLNCYLALGYILSPMTIYKDVYKLEPATYMRISQQGAKVEKRKYWHYADCFRNKTSDREEEIDHKNLYLLEKAVKRRMISDVPVGAFLSGGLDSSSIVALMKKYHSGPLHTFSMGFDESSYNELADADRAAAWIGTDHHNHICKVESGREMIDSAIDAYDEPFADNSLIPMIEVSRIAAAHVKVVLSGDGADEMFAGYITYKADNYYRYAKMLPISLKKQLVGIFSRMNWLEKGEKLSWPYKAKQFFHGSLYSPEHAHYLWRIIFHPEERVALMGERYRDLIFDSDPFRIFQKYYEEVKGLHWLDKNLYVDGMTWLPDDILVKVDRATMRSSIEARSPYLDIDLVNYAASLSPRMKMKGFETKYCLRKALKSILPRFILEKPKSGFNAPTGAWIGYDGVDEFKAFTKYVLAKKGLSCLN